MASNFNSSKYKQLFEQRFGKGSYDTGLSKAREIGTTKAQAAFAKQEADARLKALKKAQEEYLKQLEEQETYGGVSKETFEARLKEQGKITAQQEKAQAQGRGGHLPTRENQMKEKKKTESAKVDITKLTPYQKQKRGLTPSWDEKKDDKKKKKKSGPSLLDDIGAAGKAAAQFFNPFDDVSGKEAVDNYLNRKTSKTFDESARLSSRALDSLTVKSISNLDKKVNDRTPSYTSNRKFGEGGGLDMIADAAGYLVPGVGAYKLLNASKAGKALTTLGSKGLTQKLGSEAAKGAIAGAGLSGAEVAVREGLNPKETNFKDNLKLIGLGTAAGAIADPALFGLGKLASNGLGKLAKGEVPTFTGKPSDNVLERLRPISSSNSRNQSDSLYTDLLNGNRQTATPSQALNEAAATSTPATSTLRPGRDFEPITSQTEPPLIRVRESNIDHTQGNAESFRNKVDRTAKKKGDSLFSGLRTQFIDDLAPLENLEKKLVGKLPSAEESLYKTARTFKGSPEKAHLIVQEQLHPVIRDIEKAGYTYQDLGDYALAVHAKDVNSKGINSGFSNAEIDDVISKLGSEEMEAARQKLSGVNNHVLDMLSSGDAPIISQESVAAMREKYPNYMPLFRSFDDDKVDFANGLTRALSGASSPIKKLEGSSRDVVDPLESVIKNIFKATNVVDRNNVASKLGKLADADTEGNFIRKLGNSDDTSRLNVISVTDNGQKVKYEVPPDVYKAMMNLDKESTNTLIKILQKPASLLRAGATLTPEFSLRNPLRDVPQAFIVSNSGFNPIVDFPVGLWQSIWKGRTIKIGNKEFKTSGDIYKQFIKENGGYGNIVSMDRELHRKTLQKALTEVNENYVDVLSPKTLKLVLKKLANPIDTLRTIADVSESATKVGEFRAAIRSGATPQEAAYRARDIMDFARAGVSVREANKVVAFLNANIQGKSKLFRAFKENPAKVSGKAMVAVTIPTIGAIVAQNTLANDKQKALLDDAPQWLKDTFFLVPIPGTDQIARIPKPFDLAFAFSNTIERAVDFVKKHDKDAFDGWLKEGFSTMAVPTMLTGVAPVVEGMANYSFFRQSPIIPEREENLEFPDQYDVNTTGTARVIGSGINKVTGGQGAFKNFGSPRIIDNTIQGFTGGLGSYVTSGVDGLVNIFTDEDKPERPAKGVDQQPLLRAFLVNQSSSGDSLDKLYNLKETLTKQRGSAKQNEKQFQGEMKYQVTNDATKNIGEINKEIRSIQNSSEYNGQQKKELLDKLIAARNEMAIQALQQLKNME